MGAAVVAVPLVPHVLIRPHADHGLIAVQRVPATGSAVAVVVPVVIHKMFLSTASCLKLKVKKKTLK